MSMGVTGLQVHLSDNDGTADQHLEVDWAPHSRSNQPDHIRKPEGQP